jgi:hypothetical protein
MPKPDARPDELPRPGSERCRWPLLALLLPLLPLAVLLASSLEIQRRLPLRLSPGIAVQSEPFQLRGSGWGAPELRLRVSLPANSSASYDLDLLDTAGRPVLGLSKEGWREVSRWNEEGESGVEDAADSDVAITLRPPKTGLYRLQVELTELLDAAGRPLAQPLTAELRVRNHAVDGPWLGFTALLGSGMVLLALAAFWTQGRQRHHCRRQDRHLDLRAVVGGSGLVRLSVKARYDPGLRPLQAWAASALPATLQPSAARQLAQRATRLLRDVRLGRADGAGWGQGVVGHPRHPGAGGIPGFKLIRAAADAPAAAAPAAHGRGGASRPWERRRQPPMGEAALAGRGQSLGVRDCRPGAAVMERHLILLLALLAVLLGTSQALLRQGVFQLGQSGPPPLGSGVRWRPVAGMEIDGAMPRRTPAGRQRWSRFQGRGPSGAK